MIEEERKVALIAGGSGSIGGAAAKRLAREGLRVFLSYRRNVAAAKYTAGEINAGGWIARSVQLDLSDPDGPERVCKEIYDRCGRLDVLVNAAGLNIEAPALGMDDEAWRKVLDVNLSGAFRLCREAGKYMLLGRGGRIINITSVSGSFGGRGQVNYAASKHGLEAVTRVLALELGRKGVLVNAIAPGIIETPMSGRIREEHGERVLDAVALRRFGLPEEVAEVAWFLASDAASYITGQVIRVDGGMFL